MKNLGHIADNKMSQIGEKIFFFFFFFGFYPGLVQLCSAGLPLRSWWTIGAPSVQGAIPMSIFRFSYQVAVVGFEPPTF